MSSRLRSWIHSLRSAHDARPASLRTDGELVTAFAATRDEGAFAELVRRHGPMVLATCRRILHPDTSMADDAFQATFLVLATKAAAVSPPDRVGAWLHGVAVNVARKARAWSRKLASSTQTALEKVPSRAAEPDPDAAFVRTAIDDVLAGLPAKYRSPVVLCELEGRSRAEAAAALGWTEGTLSGRLARAKKLLADRLNRRGIALPSSGLTVALLAQPATAIVPAQLAASTVTSATLVAAGAAAAEVTSEPVAALVRAGVPSMSTTVKVLIFGVVGIGVALGGFGLVKLYDAATAAPPAGPVVKVPVTDEPKGWATLHTLSCSDTVLSVAFGRDGIAAGDKGGMLRLFDAKTGKKRDNLLELVELIDDKPEPAQPIERIQFSADGDRVFVVANKGNDIWQWSFKAGGPWKGIRDKGDWSMNCVTADGAYWLQTVGEHKELLLLPTRPGTGKLGDPQDARFKHENAIDFVAADTADVLVTITKKTAVPVLRRWSLGKDAPLWETELRDFAATGVAVAPGGTLIAVTGDAGQIWVFDARNGKRVSQAESITGRVSRAAFSPDGKQIAAACADKTARVFDTRTGKELAVLRGHTGAVTSVAFSPDGERIVTGSSDKTARVWGSVNSR